MLFTPPLTVREEVKSGYSVHVSHAAASLLHFPLWQDPCDFLLSERLSVYILKHVFNTHTGGLDGDQH